ncbi:endonuclease III domain-containing protein [Pseudodesulfovibrio tunisiensis]|uniref:endonuclease III domain-containing protein n=1 Tax=Pseudodesulfovibrio tunisiensis TaxID=463192 RepID=UPI001FB3A427|nr:endonuclease III domain-containing protein [Pseudodesulfovibrio tunisiensis]
MGTFARLTAMYDTLLSELGPSGWWPAQTRFEVIVGAILGQNTSWRNVTRAMANLHDRNLLNGPDLLAMPVPELAEIIRPAGYYNMKAKRLHNLLRFLDEECAFDLESLMESDPIQLRERLLSVNGVGPETGDSILLYALDMPVFVVDAYTARIAHRHGLIQENVSYEELQALFMDALPEDVALYNEFHALLVRVGNQWCKKKAGLCEQCPLQPFLDDA